ncbi:MAG TPA: ABC transporter ATP-binding protein [Clostridia bacterium]|nr:ABC transporter ATP-binding protein [Clostridia bacterium]
MKEPLLSVTDLVASYGEIEAIHGLNLEVYSGELVALLGVNGSGKSTTLKAIAGTISQTRGSVRFAGEEIRGKKPEQIVRKGIALVPEGRELFTNLTVEENLRMGAFTTYSRSSFNKDLEPIFEIFPILKERYKQNSGQLSGGEQQQLAIARAMLAKPRLLMLDEPSLGLAPVLIDQIFSLIDQMHQQDMTILLVEQNVERTLDIVDRVYLLETGKVQFSGSAAELAQASDALSSAYLGSSD